MDLNPFGQKTNQKKTQRPTNFIEALKEMSASFKNQAKDATWGIGRGAADQILGAPKTPAQPQSGELSPDKPFDFGDWLKSQERQIEQRHRQKYEQKIREERMIFHHKQEEAKLQIKAVQNELKKLAQATKGLSVEVKKAVFSAPVDPGTYHENFFDRLKRLMEIARQKINESRSWLQVFNHRSKKKSYYWHHVKKSGTKFMLSQERYMATQVG